MGVANEPEEMKDPDRDLYAVGAEGPLGPKLTVTQAAIIQGFPAHWEFMRPEDGSLPAGWERLSPSGGPSGGRADRRRPQGWTRSSAQGNSLSRGRRGRLPFPSPRRVTSRYALGVH